MNNEKKLSLLMALAAMVMRVFVLNACDGGNEVSNIDLVDKNEHIISKEVNFF